MSRSFVRVENGALRQGSERYAFVGTNLWYGANLASSGPGGDRHRLVAELDRLAELGVNNLRVMAGSLGPSDAPWRIQPPLQPAPGQYDPQVLDGLDFLVAAASERNMRLVMCLTNFWFWSGGMAQYVRWNGGGPIPYPLDERHSWTDFSRYAASFFLNAGAQQAFERHLRFIVTRHNPITGIPYAEDPAIMAWELANEPRGMDHPRAMRAWIDTAAALIKSLDGNHLVTTGTEGMSDNPQAHGLDFVADHQSRHVDYATVHLWVQNWGWLDPADPATFDHALARAREYVDAHIRAARRLGKPLVLEEFGIGRDGGAHDPAAPTELRSRFYASVLAQLHEAAGSEPHVAGANFWAWAGGGRPAAPGQDWTPGDTWTGDPPHEPQGWYSVYDSTEETSTLEIIQRFALAMDNLL